MRFSHLKISRDKTCDVIHEFNRDCAFGLLGYETTFMDKILGGRPGEGLSEAARGTFPLPESAAPWIKQGSVEDLHPSKAGSALAGMPFGSAALQGSACLP